MNVKDLQGSWEKFTGVHSGLYGRKDETGEKRYLNVNWAVQYWLNHGLIRDKLVLGLSAYGRTFTLADENNYRIGAPATGPGTMGKVIDLNMSILF